MKSVLNIIAVENLKKVKHFTTKNLTGKIN